jgi:hypothetical protein
LGFINEKTSDTIKILIQILDTYLNTNKKICIGYKQNNTVIRYCDVLEEFEITKDEIYLELGNFIFQINQEIKNIEFFEDYESVNITFDQEQLCLDFN